MSFDERQEADGTVKNQLLALLQNFIDQIQTSHTALITIKQEPESDSVTSNKTMMLFVVGWRWLS